MIGLTGFRYCPRCGHEGIVGEGPNAMRCTACGLRYFHNCAAAVAAIIETPRGIVTVRRASPPGKGLYDLPGGFVDYGETLEGALCREVMEELGLALQNPVYFGSFPNTYTFGSVTYHTTDAVFRCSGAGGMERLLPNREIQRVRILAPRSIDLDMIAFDSIRAALTKYIESRG